MVYFVVFLGDRGSNTRFVENTLVFLSNVIGSSGKNWAALPRAPKPCLDSNPFKGKDSQGLVVIPFDGKETARDRAKSQIGLYCGE